MSGWLVGKVWQSGLYGPLKPFASMLADIGDDDGQNIYPSIQYMMWLMNVSERTIRRWLSDLRDRGVLTIVGDVQDVQKCGRGYGIEYCLDPKNLPVRESWSGPKVVRRRGDKMAYLSGKGVPNDVERGAKRRRKGVPNTTQIAPVSTNDPLVDPSRDIRADAPLVSETVAVLPQPISPQAELLEYHRQRFTEVIGEPPKAAEKYHFKQAYELVKRFGVERAKTFVDQLFATQDKFLQGTDYSWSVFVKFIDKLVVEQRRRQRPAATKTTQTRNANEVRKETRDANVAQVAAGEFFFVGLDDDKEQPF